MVQHLCLPPFFGENLSLTFGIHTESNTKISVRGTLSKTVGASWFNG